VLPRQAREFLAPNGEIHAEARCIFGVCRCDDGDGGSEPT
jgi:hypothetical protein